MRRDHRAQAAVTQYPVRIARRHLVAFLVAVAILALVATLALRPQTARANGIGTIFVANERANTVSVIEHAGNTVLASIPVGAGPRAVDFTRDGRFALVANRGAGTISMIDRDQYQVAATVRASTTAEDISAPLDATFSVLADGAGRQLAVVDSAGATVRTIQTPGRPLAIAADRGGRRTYVSIESGDVAVYDATSGSHLGNIAVGGSPGHITLTPDGAVAYVSLPANGAVAIVDAPAGRLVATVPTAAGAAGSALTRDGRQLLVANSAANNVTIVDLASRQPAGTIAVGTGPQDVAVSPDGSPYAYVANTGADTVSVIDLSRRTVSKTLRVGQGPISIAVASVPGPGVPMQPSGQAGAAGQGGPGLGAPAGDAAGQVFTTGQQGGSTAPATGGTQQGGVSVQPAQLPNTGAAEVAAPAPAAAHGGRLPALVLAAAAVWLGGTIRHAIPFRRFRTIRAPSRPSA
jgi:YVTN family beta-propeller protein